MNLRVIPEKNEVQVLQPSEPYGPVFWARRLSNFIERAMRKNPGYLTEEFEFFYFNEDILHTSTLDFVLSRMQWR
jgi:hypothetical protein